MLAAVAALSFAAPALAADPGTDFAPGTAPVTAAQDIATTFWQGTPCAGQVSIVWMGLTDTVNATSTWTNPVGQYDAPEQNTSCQIAFNNKLQWDWTRFCSILVHEYGHLSGHPHAEAASDIMYPFYEAPLAQCVAAAPAQPAAAETAITTPPTQVLPALKVAAADSAQPRAVTSSRSVKRGVLVVVREPRRHGKHQGAKHHHKHRGHARPHHKHQRHRRHVGKLVRA